MIRGLTVRQPMAWALASGAKPVENRTWRPWRGVTHIAIHAGAHVDPRYREAVERMVGALPAEAEICGAIVGVARIARCVTSHPSPWFVGPFGWVLEGARPIVPIQRAGSLGLWRLTEAELEAVAA